MEKPWYLQFFSWIFSIFHLPSVPDWKEVSNDTMSYLIWRTHPILFGFFLFFWWISILEATEGTVGGLRKEKREVWEKELIKILDYWKIPMPQNMKGQVTKKQSN